MFKLMANRGTGQGILNILSIMSGRDHAPKAMGKAKHLLYNQMHRIMRNRAFFGELGSRRRAICAADGNFVVRLTLYDRHKHGFHMAIVLLEEKS